MRRTLIVLTMLAVQIPVLGATASHAPNSYCSESGDVCTSTKKDDGVRKLKIVLAAKYFDSYKLCVTAPDESRTCKAFDIGKMGEQYGDSVRWDRQFPDKGEGAYTVHWKSGGESISKALGFHN